MTPPPTASPPPDRRPAPRPSATGTAVREAWKELAASTGQTGPAWVEVVLVAVAVLVGIVGGAAMGPWGLVLGLAQILPLPWRRTRPLLVAGIVASGCLLQLAVTDVPHPANIAVLVVVYSAAAFGDRRTSRIVLGLALVGALLASLDWRVRYGTFWDLTGMIVNAVFLGLFVGVAWVLGDVVRRRQAVLERLREQNRALARDHAQRTRLAAQDERASIAREMHDVVAHSLAVVVVQADGALYAARTALDRPPAIGPDRAALEQAASTLETLAQTARSSLAETRKLVGVLREEGAGAEYSPLRGLAHLEELADGVRDSGLPVHLAVRGRIDDLPSEVDLAAYRVVQEALTNALKHAGPDAQVDVDVLRTPAVLLVRVSDDGLGLSPDSDGEGNGILGMAERVELLGGHVQAGPRPRGGWEVVATVPVATVAVGDGPRTGADGIPTTAERTTGAQQ